VHPFWQPMQYCVCHSHQSQIWSPWSQTIPSIADFSSGLTSRKLKLTCFPLSVNGARSFSGVVMACLCSTRRKQVNPNMRMKKKPDTYLNHFFSISTTACSTASIANSLSDTTAVSLSFIQLSQSLSIHFCSVHPDVGLPSLSEVVLGPLLWPE